MSWRWAALLVVGCARSGDVFMVTASVCEPTEDTVERINPGGGLTSLGLVVAGGASRDGRVLATSARFEQATGRFLEVAPLGEARVTPSSLTDSRGRLWLLGGVGVDGGLSSVERFEPSTRRWVGAPAMSTPRWLAESTELPDGRLVVAGGRTPSVTATVEALGVGAQQWVALPSMFSPRADAASVLLDGGWLLAGGGECVPGGCVWRTGAAERFEPMTGGFRSLASMPSPATALTATLLDDGEALFLSSDGAAVYSPTDDRWRPLALPTGPRSNHTATRVDDGSVWIIGGERFATGQVFDEVLRYERQSDSFSVVHRLAQGRVDHLTVRLPNGALLVVGGRLADGGAAGAEVLEAGAASWKTLDPRVFRCQE